MRRKGPGIARPKKNSDYSFGYLAVTVLNFGVRPVLARWHPKLQDWEAAKPAKMSAHDHEAAWEHNAELRDELARLRRVLREYAALLARVAGVPDLIDNELVENAAR